MQEAVNHPLLNASIKIILATVDAVAVSPVKHLFRSMRQASGAGSQPPAGEERRPVNDYPVGSASKGDACQVTGYQFTFLFHSDQQHDDYR